MNDNGSHGMNDNGSHGMNDNGSHESEHQLLQSFFEELSNFGKTSISNQGRWRQTYTHFMHFVDKVRNEEAKMRKSGTNISMKNLLKTARDELRNHNEFLATNKPKHIKKFVLWLLVPLLLFLVSGVHLRALSSAYKTYDLLSLKQPDLVFLLEKATIAVYLGTFLAWALSLYRKWTAWKVDSSVFAAKIKVTAKEYLKSACILVAGIFLALLSIDPPFTESFEASGVFGINILESNIIIGQWQKGWRFLLSCGFVATLWYFWRVFKRNFLVPPFNARLEEFLRKRNADLASESDSKPKRLFKGFILSFVLLNICIITVTISAVAIEGYVSENVPKDVLLASLRRVGLAIGEGGSTDIVSCNHIFFEKEVFKPALTVYRIMDGRPIPKIVYLEDLKKEAEALKLPGLTEVQSSDWDLITKSCGEWNYLLRLNRWVEEYWESESASEREAGDAAE
jgi:hypothetical protein